MRVVEYFLRTYSGGGVEEISCWFCQSRTCEKNLLTHHSSQLFQRSQSSEVCFEFGLTGLVSRGF